MRDLVVLVADLDAENVIRGLLSRPEALGIRPITFDVFRHPQRDPGCRGQASDFLVSFTRRYKHGLVIFDHEGSGREQTPAEDLGAELTKLLSQRGWEDRAICVVIHPELEQWAWSDSPQVEAALGWTGRAPSLRAWLLENNWLTAGTVKPARPKEAMHAALRSVRRVPSASIFLQLAQTVSLGRCKEPSFHRLRDALKTWFSASPTE